MTPLVGRWSTDGATFHEQISDPEGLAIRWALTGFGLVRMEFLMRARNKWDRYARYKDHLGQRAGAYSPGYPRPIAGFISEVRPAGANRVQYIVKGPGWRLDDDRDTTIYTSPTDTLDTIIKTVLTDHVTVADSDQSNIAANTTQIGQWQPRYPEGSTPRDIFEQLLKMSDSAGAIYDLWFEDMAFSGVTLPGWRAHYAARSSSASANWAVNVNDLIRLTPSRDINKLVTDVEIFYGVITGARDSDTGTWPEDDYLLYDGTATFQQNGVQPGDRIVNITDGSRAKVQRLEYNVPDTVLYTTALEGGSDNSWDANDSYAIERNDALDSQVSTATATYWTKKYREVRREMTSTQADQYADLLIVNAAAQNTPFTITAPYVRDGNGARWPLWEMIAQGGGYIRISDIYPAAAMYTNSQNQETTFFITGMDYNGGPRPSLTVEVDNPSRRLDARLRAAGIIGSEIVARV